MIDRRALDFMLDEWARFYLSEFNEVNWAKLSMSGKIMEYAELGIMSSGTKHQENNHEIPDHISKTVKAISQLEAKYQQAIKEEYTGTGTQHKKAKGIQLSLSRFRNRLHRARKMLMQML